MNSEIDAGFNPFSGGAIARSVASTEAQREIWSALQMGAEAARAYHEAVAFRIVGALDVAVLRSALETLTHRHESLRATFSRDGLTMLIGAEANIDLVEYNWYECSAPERSELLGQLHREVVTDAYDLEHGPLVRFRIARMTSEDTVLVIGAHHIVCDGWSFGVLAHDIKALYDHQLTRATTTALPLPLPDQFTDYAAELRGPEQREALQDAERYWTKQFAEIPEPLELPLDRTRPLQKTYASVREDFNLPLSLLNAVRSVGARENSSLFVTLLAGFSALVARLCAQDDVVVGIPSAGQAAFNRLTLVGHCVNMLPVRIRASATAAFGTFVHDVRHTMLDAFEHQSIGFGQLLELLPIPRDPGRTPLISVVFNLERALRDSTISFAGCHVNMRSVPRVAENFELFVNAVEYDDGLVLECQYNRDLFDGSTIRRWMAAYQQLLQSVVENPAATIGQLAIRTDEDEAALAAINDSAMAIPANMLVHQLVEAQAALTPERVAVEQGSVAVTYQQLNEAANRLAHHLRSAGVKRGDMVGLYLDRTPATLVALLGVLKSGAAYVPLDVAQPLERLKVVVSEAKLALVLTDDTLRSDASTLTSHVVSLDHDAALIAACRSDNLPADESSARNESPAYVLFTSGSTGVPKGVVVPHSSLVNLLLSVQHVPGLSGDDVVLAITTLSFDIAVSEVLLPLTVGARIVLASRDVATDGALLRDLIESRGVTFIDATPATYNMLLDAGWQGGLHLRLICTGEAMPLELARKLVTCARELWNGYGPTETTVWSTFHRVQAPVERVLIGRPVANTRISIRDAHGQETPSGVAGELFIGGRGVANGYLNRDALTTERFSVDAASHGTRWYRTGDLVRLLPSGELECLGRTDDQVKIRGYRIEPGEISAVIMQWGGVHQVVVVARGSGTDRRLVAYVVAEDHVTFDDAFRQHLKQFLPGYMIPSSVMRIAAMPLTSSGKIDKKKLPEPERAATATAFIAPRTATERLLAELWSTALRTPRISVSDDFFELGGHSVLAAQILSRLRRDHGIDLTFRRVFELPTIEALASFVDAERLQGAVIVAPTAIPARVNASISPVSALQERLWMLEELEPHRRCAHSHPASWRFTGELDAGSLERALQNLLKRHAILRTRFVVRDGKRVQQTLDEVQFSLGQLDLAHLNSEAQSSAMHAYFSSQQLTPFELDHAPLFRATLIKLGNDSHLLYTLQHGLVWDGWSFDLFLRDLSALYELETGFGAPLLAPLAITYGDFAAWQPEWLESPAAESQRVWWDNILSSAQEGLRLPQDHVRPDISAFAGSQVSLEFTDAEVEQLQQLARRNDGSLYMVMLSAYAALLQRYSAQSDILIASPMQARARPECEDIIGPFVNTVVQRFALRPRMTFRDLFAMVRDQAVESYSRQEIPFERLESRLPGIQTVFSMQDARNRPRAMGALRVEQMHVPLQFATNDLTLWCMQYPDRLLAYLNFSTEVVSRDSAATLLQHLRSLVLAFAEAGDDVVVDDVALGVEETTHHLTTPSDSAAPDVLQALEDTANTVPAQTAVRWGNRTITFSELWTRSARVASAVQARVGHRGGVVAIDMATGPDRVVATIGVLRAGATVLPLSPDDSASYRRSVVVESGALLTIASRPGDDAIAFASLESESHAPPLQATSRGGAFASWFDAPPGQAAHPSGSSIPWTRLNEQVHHSAEAMALSLSSVVLQGVPSSSVVSVHALLATLSRGATAVLVADDVFNDVTDLSDDSASAGCTTMIGTAESWRLVLDKAWSGATFSNGLCIGAGLAPDEQRMLCARGALTHTTFGPARDATLSAVQRLSPEGENWFVGTAVAGTRFDVRDAQRHPVLPGMPGWLYVGYTGMPDDHVMLETGFRARTVPAGDIQLLADGGSTLWIDGASTSADSLDLWMRNELGAFDLSTTLQPDGNGVPRLVAHIATTDESSSMAVVRTKLRNTGPRVCIPVRVVPVPSIPRNIDGKPLRALLPSPFSRENARTTVALQTPEEQLLGAVWREALQLETVGRNDNFFSLGGTSLTCFRVIARVRAQTLVRLSPRVLLTGTLAQVAEQLAGVAPPL